MRRFIAVTLLAFGALALSACAPTNTTAPSSESSQYSSAPMEAASSEMMESSSSAAAMQPSSPAAASHESVKIHNFVYSPQTLRVKRGTVVTWTNDDTPPHTVTGDNGGPASGQLSTGQSYSFRFDTAGTFPYHCSIHPTMQASVIVQ